MKRFIEGESRTQSTLLPELLDDYITEANLLYCASNSACSLMRWWR